VVVASGYLLQSRLQLDLHPVNRPSLYLLSPALIFSSLAQSRIEVPKVALGTVLRLGLSVPLPAPLNDL
jgi:predicted permease